MRRSQKERCVQDQRGWRPIWMGIESSWASENELFSSEVKMFLWRGRTWCMMTCTTSFVTHFWHQQCHSEKCRFYTARSFSCLFFDSKWKRRPANFLAPRRAHSSRTCFRGRAQLINLDVIWRKWSLNWLVPLDKKRKKKRMRCPKWRRSPSFVEMDREYTTGWK